MTRDGRLGLALLVAAVALGVAGDVLFRGRPVGINVLVWAFLFVAALAALLRVGRVPLHQGRRWMAAPLLVFAAAFAWHDSPLLVAVDLLALAGAVALGALRRTAPRVARAGVADYAAGLAAAGFSTFAGAVHLLHRDVPWDEAGRGLRGSRAGAFARGLAIALPLLALFGGLFLAADAVFKSFVVAALPNPRTLWLHALVIAAFGWGAAGLLRDLVAAREERRLFSPAIAVPRRPGSTEIAVAVAVLDLLFLAFVLVQLRYLFGGKGLVEARAHLTYATYARHGFFELVAVAVLVLPVVLAANTLARGRATRIASAALVLLLFVVIASALQRMRLYEQQFGLTELRLYATGSILWLATVFVWLGVTVLRGRPERFAFGALVAGFVASAAINVLDPDALIARTNLSRPHVDVAYLAGLSDDAVPTLLARLPSVRPELRQPLARALLARGEPRGGLLSWNYARDRAAELLARDRSELERLAR